ncbi:hypothetical protein AAMO2058_001320100 [Amorphochlora amoebiformis]
MGACSSSQCKKCHERATIRQIRQRLDIIFRRLDKDNDGRVSLVEATKCILNSRRQNSYKNKNSACRVQIEQMFKLVGIDHEKSMTSDQFIAVYSGILYNRKFTLEQFQKALVKMFGRDIAGDCPFKAVPTKKTSISRVAIAAVPVRSGRSYSTSEFSKRINTI